MQRQLAEPPAAAQYIQHHHKADAAQDDHPIGDKVQPKVIAVGDQAVAAAQHIEPCIVKGSDRVEHADPGGMQRRIVPGKHRVAGHRADALHQQSHGHNGPHQLDHAPETFHVEGLPHQAAAAETDAPPRRNGQPHADRGYAQAPQLHQHCQHGLAEQRKGIAGVHRDQPGHADSAGGGKQSVQPRQLPGPAHRDGQREQRRADEDEHRKAKGDGARRRLLFCYFFEVFHIFTCDS